MGFLAFLDRFALPVFRRPAVPEIASEVRAGLDNLADAIRTHAAVLASCAAVEHSRDYGDQRNMAMVIYEDASQLFKELNERLDPKRKEQLDAWIDGLCKGKKK